MFQLLIDETGEGIPKSLRFKWKEKMKPLFIVLYHILETWKGAVYIVNKWVYVLPVELLKRPTIVAMNAKFRYVGFLWVIVFIGGTRLLKSQHDVENDWVLGFVSLRKTITDLNSWWNSSFLCDLLKLSQMHVQPLYFFSNGLITNLIISLTGRNWKLNLFWYFSQTCATESI